jgi:hypothetical protein
VLDFFLCDAAQERQPFVLRWTDFQSRMPSCLAMR